MPRKGKSNIVAPRVLPTPEEAIEVVKECLKGAGVPVDAVDILPTPYNLISPTPIAGASDQLLPLYVAVVKSSGLALFFPALGEFGIYQRWRDKQASVH